MEIIAVSLQVDSCDKWKRALRRIKTLFERKNYYEYIFVLKLWARRRPGRVVDLISSLLTGLSRVAKQTSFFSIQTLGL